MHDNAPSFVANSTTITNNSSFQKSSRGGIKCLLVNYHSSQFINLILSNLYFRNDNAPSSVANFTTVANNSSFQKSTGYVIKYLSVNVSLVVIRQFVFV